jgi:hypothetical protein
MKPIHITIIAVVGIIALTILVALYLIRPTTNFNQLSSDVPLAEPTSTIDMATPDSEVPTVPTTAPLPPVPTIPPPLPPADDAITVPEPTEPADPIACTMDVQECPDGSYVGRVAPNCAFAACPPMPAEPEPIVCTEEAKQCPDGSYVSRVAPSCEFASCPAVLTPNLQLQP